MKPWHCNLSLGGNTKKLDPKNAIDPSQFNLLFANHEDREPLGDPDQGRILATDLSANKLLQVEPLEQSGNDFDSLYG